MKKVKFVTILLVLVMVSLSLLGCQTEEQSSASVEEEMDVTTEAETVEESAKEDEDAESAAAGDEELFDVSLRLNWQPQTEHAGFYMALWKGYYEELGLNVTIEPVGSELQAVPQVASGGDDFGLTEPHNVIISRSKDVPVVAIMQVQHDAYLRYVAKKANGIETLEDAKGKIASLWFGGGEYEFLAMLNSVGLSDQDVELIAQRAGLAPFFEDEVDITSVTLYNELQQIYAEGYTDEDLTIFAGKDFGVGLVADGLITTEKMIEEHPDVVQAFVTASIRGWQYAYYNPEETAQMFVDEFADLDYDKMLVMMNIINELNTVGKGKEMGLGYMDHEYFETGKDVMELNELLESDVDLDQCYDLTFWENTPEEYKVTD